MGHRPHCRTELQFSLQSGALSRREKGISMRPILGWSSCARTASQMRIGVSMTRILKLGPLCIKALRQPVTGPMDKSPTVATSFEHIFRASLNQARGQDQLQPQDV